jgi:hypothetical protein
MSPDAKIASKLMPVSTILTPGERQRVDAAAEGLYAALHRESFDEVLADLRERRSGAVLISIANMASRAVLTWLPWYGSSRGYLQWHF